MRSRSPCLLPGVRAPNLAGSTSQIPCKSNEKVSTSEACTGRENTRYLGSPVGKCIPSYFRGANWDRFASETAHGLVLVMGGAAGGWMLTGPSAGRISEVRGGGTWKYSPPVCPVLALAAFCLPFLPTTVATHSGPGLDFTPDLAWTYLCTSPSPPPPPVALVYAHTPAFHV